MAITQGRAEILKEADNQYTLLIYKRVDTGDSVIQEGVSGFNKTLVNAYNESRDAFQAMIGGSDKVYSVIIEVTIKP